MTRVESTQHKPLKRFYKVILSEKEVITLRQHVTEKAGLDFLSGTPRLIKKRNGEYIAKIFKRFGIIDGSYTAIGKIKFIDQQNLKVVVKSGGLGIGYFMFTIFLLFTIALVVLLFLPDVVEELELNLWALIIGIPILAFMSWIFLSRYMRISEIDTMERYLKDKIGGDWHEEI